MNHILPGGLSDPDAISVYPSPQCTVLQRADVQSPLLVLKAETVSSIS